MRRTTPFLVLALLAARAVRAGEAPAVAWNPWSDTVFARARREDRLVLLDLEAVWCHWCHVMDETTYRDPEVVRLLNERFVAIRVDQDARPDIANRYQDWGWPATILFDPRGREIAKRRGFLNPAQMASMLRAFAEDASPGPSVRKEKPLPAAGATRLSPALRRELEEAYVARYDEAHGGWGFGHKFLDPDAVELSLLCARGGDAAAERRARQTLAAGEALLDPVWGGVYQYSAGGDWKEPHFEKIVPMQAGNLRAYALAYAQWHEPAHLRIAEAIHRYLAAFLTSPDGAFYTSQDADLVPGEHAADYFALDDAGRRARGIPRVDTHVYSRENGLLVEALAALHAATGRADVLAGAVRAAEWVLAHRSLPGGGFTHGDADPAGPYLADTLAMARGFVALHGETGDERWLRRAKEAADFADRTFRIHGKGRAGFATAVTAGSTGGTSLLLSRPDRDENVSLVRLASRLFGKTGDPRFRRMAREAMSTLAVPAVAREGPVTGILLADRELRGIALNPGAAAASRR